MLLHLKVIFNSLGYMETGQRLSLIQQSGEADGMIQRNKLNEVTALYNFEHSNNTINIYCV